MRYTCDQCDYKVTQKRNLKSHIKSVHENVRYICDQCIYTTMQKTDLKRHIESVHEDVRYCCDQCDYNSKWKGDLKKTYRLSSWTNKQEKEAVAIESPPNKKRKLEPTNQET